MSNSYEEIIGLPHHVSKTRKRMSMTDRAAQFSPFAALTGYDASIQEMRRVTDARAELGADGEALLNEQLRQLALLQQQEPEVAVTYFIPDQRKKGGAYISITGRVRGVDAGHQCLLLTDGTQIAFADIYELRQM